MVVKDRYDLNDVLKLKKLAPNRIVAERLPVTRGHASNIEGAIKNIPLLTSDRTLMEMATELGVSYRTVVNCRIILRKLGVDVKDRRGLKYLQKK